MSMRSSVSSHGGGDWLAGCELDGRKGETLAGAPPTDFVSYVQSIAHSDQTKSMLGDRSDAKSMIDLHQIRVAVRRLHRAASREASAWEYGQTFGRERGASLLRELHDAILAYSNLKGLGVDPAFAIEHWFSMIDVSQAGKGDGLVTKVELRDGIRMMQQAFERART